MSWTVGGEWQVSGQRGWRGEQKHGEADSEALGQIVDRRTENIAADRCVQVEPRR